MMEPKLDSPQFDHPSKTFLGVRFVLLGFDPIIAPKVRSKLVGGGGVDVGQYGPNCTHVIVDKLVYDDPICVAARSNGKTLVTGLWVDRSFDIGMPADTTSIMYRPLRDLNGIPGAKSLIVCLTGYQRQDRDDVMTMVGLMDANFSKPLVANKVTHLICYKFEGEKYELAKKMKKIKIVNHWWLEDCLRAWEILPEAGYDKSGYELEMVEAEAKDSEEETEDNGKEQYVDRKIHASLNLQIGVARAHQSPILKAEISQNVLDASASIDVLNVGNSNKRVMATGKQSISDQSSTLDNVNKKHIEVPGSGDTRTVSDVTCGELSEQQFKTFDRTPTVAKIGNDLSSTSGSAKRSPQSDAANLTVRSYSRKKPMRTTLSIHSGDMASNTNSFPKISSGELNVSHSFDIPACKVEQAKNETDSGCAQTPSGGTKLFHEEGQTGILSEKRKLDVSYGGSKSQKMSHNPKACISEGPSPTNRTEGLEPASLINVPSEINNTLFPGNNAHFLDETDALRPVQKSPGNISATKSPCVNRISLPHDMTTKTVTSEVRQDENVKEAPQTLFIGLKKTSLAGRLDVNDDVMSREEDAVSEVGKPKNDVQDTEVSSPRTRRLEIEKSRSVATLDLPKEGNAESLSKPVRRKMLTKKGSGLGPRPKLVTGIPANQKGSIFLNETASKMDAVTCLTVGKETAEHEKFANSVELEMVPQTVNVDEVMAMETGEVSKPGVEVENKSVLMDDETEAPEEHEFELVVTNEVEPSHMVDKVKEDKSEGVHCITNETKGKILGMHDHAMTSDEDKNGTELGNTVCGKKTEPHELNSKLNAVTEKNTKRKKHPLSKTKKKTLPIVTEVRKSNEDVIGESEKNIMKKEKEKKRNISCPGKIKGIVPVNKWKNSMEVEKENRPISFGDQTVGHGKQSFGKVASKSTRMLMEMHVKAVESGQDSMQVDSVPKVKIEPAWFILSGHKLQRKEFQQFIRRLKGRVCRDSHQWSYQATHFIVPDPMRRTEKFFAAAASGRWILKMDYLTASYQAGRFLAEEPYEWHKSGLSEDGAINLEAPRKWRLLRERTGHGAFYGMCIVIYGECIAPPLDTLKRVVKAGDGTILATCPPYTRFLKSGVDFAIVSPGMPCVDKWVQEFLRHEIPCVVADYLVEYVCKPGYSLERHVQYNTHAWAERSFANLLNHSEEIVQEQTALEDHGNGDPPCQVTEERQC
ncbi:hypothetical protein F0562_021466 [Nyssa sinensis]|uniref:BRCT domain-containing protein n=1 Tax=Nyssa sinensis TaxID=561372 RepID=A0A5J5BJR3_9ASTE|nr:hypothetical protein F0562_021466 [Nyssa sinensis]